MTQVLVTSINLSEQASLILSLDEKIAELQELRKEKVNEIRAIMTEANITELKADSKHTFKLSQILRNSVDMARLKKEFKSIYVAFVRVGTVIINNRISVTISFNRQL